MQALVDVGISYDSFAPVFLEYKRNSNLKIRSMETLDRNVKRVSEYIGSVRLNDIDNDLLQGLVNRIADDGYSKSIMEKSVFAVTSMLKYAASKHYIESVPVFTITYPASQQRKIAVKDNWLKDSERELYEAECVRTYIPQKYCKYAGKTIPVHDSGYKLLLLLHTGIRVGEALALTWADYDEYSKTLEINKNLVLYKDQKIIQDPKTKKGYRLLVLNRRAVDDLAHLKEIFDAQTKDIESRRDTELENAKTRYSGLELKAERRGIITKYAEYLKNHEYICGSVNFPYGAGAASSLGQTHRKICKQIDLSHVVTVHGLRHTYVTHYYLAHKNDLDFDLPSFSRSIGHSSVRTTMEIYAHLDMTENKMIQRDVNDLKDF